MTILFATDGSPGAIAAAELLSWLPLTSGDLLTLLAVEPINSGAFAATREALHGTRARIEEQTVTGSPPAAILKAAQEQNVDLIAVGATGSTGLTRFFVGSVAERVLRHADRSALVARPLGHRPRRVAVAVDRSKFAGRVIQAARQFPLCPDVELCLTTVVPLPESVLGVVPFVPPTFGDDLDAALNQSVEDGKNYLRELARQLRDHSGPVSAVVVRGDPASSLLHLVEQKDMDLIILGAQGEGGVDRFLLGSVSERVARHSPCSVLIAR